MEFYSPAYELYYLCEQKGMKHLKKVFDLLPEVELGRICREWLRQEDRDHE